MLAGSSELLYKMGSLTKISAVKPLTSLLGGGAAGNSLTSRKGFRDILLLAVSKLRGELLESPGETARLRKGLLEEKFTDRVLTSRAVVLGEGRRASAGLKNCQRCEDGGARRAVEASGSVDCGIGRHETGGSACLHVFTWGTRRGIANGLARGRRTWHDGGHCGGYVTLMYALLRQSR